MYPPVTFNYKKIHLKKVLIVLSFDNSFEEDLTCLTWVVIQQRGVQCFEAIVL